MNSEAHKRARKKWEDKNPTYMEEYAATHVEENRARSMAWRKANPERAALNDRIKVLRKRYNLSLEEYDALLIAQDGHCAICPKVPTDQFLDVDHDHATERVRGLLCRRCNTAIGQFEDSPALLRAAAAYLEANVSKSI
jgi:hypothetical protein